MWLKKIGQKWEKRQRTMGGKWDPFCRGSKTFPTIPFVTISSPHSPTENRESLPLTDTHRHGGWCGCLHEPPAGGGQLPAQKGGPSLLKARAGKHPLTPLHTPPKVLKTGLPGATPSSAYRSGGGIWDITPTGRRGGGGGGQGCNRRGQGGTERGGGGLAGTPLLPGSPSGPRRRGANFVEASILLAPKAWKQNVGCQPQTLEGDEGGGWGSGGGVQGGVTPPLLLRCTAVLIYHWRGGRGGVVAMACGTVRHGLHAVRTPAEEGTCAALPRRPWSHRR